MSVPFSSFQETLGQLEQTVLITDRAGKIEYVNAAFKKVSGYSLDEVIGKTPRLLFATSLSEDHYKSIWRQLHKGVLQRATLKNQARSGQIYEEDTSISPLIDEAGRLSHTVWIGRPVGKTARAPTDTDLQYALTAYAATLESTTDAIVVIDTARVVRQLNRSFADMWRIEDAAFYKDQSGDRLLEKMQPQIADNEAFSALGRRVIRSEREMDDSIQLIDGRLLEVHTRPQIIDGAVAGQVWSFRDVTERVRMESALVEMAQLDALTGLPGRNYFQEEVNLAISRGTKGAVLFMDLDDFKAINDSLGHSAGDELLRSLALCLSKELRHDDLLARLGGDEFAVLLRGANRSQARNVAERLLKSVREMKSVSSDQPFTSTISIGAAMFPTHGASVDELLGHADMAMYQVKREGRNALHFYRAGHGSKANSMSRMVWKQKILDALENGSFVLYAQPIFELKTGRLGCYELLLRLREQNGRLTLPEKFVPIAEKSGLMPEIDAWVVEQSLAVAQSLANAPRPVKVAFNLSATAVGNPALLDLIKRRSAHLKLDPGFVSIEVTETALISDLPAARAFFSSLKELGFLVALDDFGAGFSSLSRLKEVPADYLKIAGSFVENVSHNQEDRHFIRAIADLASGLGIGAVAESVQDAEAVEILISLGVLNGQGFYLGAPRPVADVLHEHFGQLAA
jgi:diguanylate cyclase (GGDEF)-like protein/PAS domain S-box-containing protein